ncbi:MAG: SPOR domain-containing protein [Burkholderiales bacterium]|nr:SPOR domain-containing protein [Burkholderiales bacterium]
MADHEDVEALRRRGRRRLVGAIALVLVAVIVLPMVFDTEPRQSPPLSVRIPGEDEGPFSPKALPKPPPTPQPWPAAEPAPPPPKEAPATGEAPAKKTDERVAASPRVADSAADKKTEREPAAPKPPAASNPAAMSDAALAGGPKFFVQVGAFREQDKVREITGKLAAAKLPHHTEPVAIAAGTATRVRVGPYASRQAAEDALGTLQQLGLKGARVVEQAP